MSVTIDISERQLKVMIFKLALFLAGVFLIVGWVLSLLGDFGRQLAVDSLLGWFSFLMLANGVPATLRVINWFKLRRGKHGDAHAR